MVTAASCFTFSRLVSCVSCWVFLMTLLTSCRWIGDSRYKIRIYYLSILTSWRSSTRCCLCSWRCTWLTSCTGAGAGCLLSTVRLWRSWLFLSKLSLCCTTQGSAYQYHYRQSIS